MARKFVIGIESKSKQTEKKNYTLKRNSFMIKRSKISYSGISLKKILLTFSIKNGKDCCVKL